MKKPKIPEDKVERTNDSNGCMYATAIIAIFAIIILEICKR